MWLLNNIATQLTDRGTIEGLRLRWRDVSTLACAVCRQFSIRSILQEEVQYWALLLLYSLPLLCFILPMHPSYFHGWVRVVATALLHCLLGTGRLVGYSPVADIKFTVQG